MTNGYISTFLVLFFATASGVIIRCLAGADRTVGMPCTLSPYALHTLIDLRPWRGNWLGKQSLPSRAYETSRIPTFPSWKRSAWDGRSGMCWSAAKTDQNRWWTENPEHCGVYVKGLAPKSNFHTVIWYVFSQTAKPLKNFWPELRVRRTVVG